MRKVKNYVRKFQEISNLQEEKVLQYSLLEEENHQYSIEVSMESNGKLEKEVETSISSSKEKVDNMLIYLYENSVLFSNWRDVTNDLIIQLKV